MFAMNTVNSSKLHKLVVLVVALAMCTANCSPLADQHQGDDKSESEALGELQPSAASADAVADLSAFNRELSNVRHELMNAIRLYKVARTLENELEQQQQQGDDADQADSAADADEYMEAAKRSSKRLSMVRNGGTRSRVKQLHHNVNAGVSEHSANNKQEPLRRIWEKNLFEKNKMYQTFHG